MSKDIWHTADIKPKSLKTFVYETDKGHIGTSMLAIDSGWNPVLLPEFYSMGDFDKAERIIKWCYLDNLLALETELERTRKALNVAVDALKVYANQENWDFEHFYLQRTYEIAGDALEQITALEQKE